MTHDVVLDRIFKKMFRWNHSEMFLWHVNHPIETDKLLPTWPLDFSGQHGPYDFPGMFITRRVTQDWLCVLQSTEQVVDKYTISVHLYLHDFTCTPLLGDVFNHWLCNCFILFQNGWCINLMWCKSSGCRGRFSSLAKRAYPSWQQPNCLANLAKAAKLNLLTGGFC